MEQSQVLVGSCRFSLVSVGSPIRSKRRPPLQSKTALMKAAQWRPGIFRWPVPVWCYFDLSGTHGIRSKVGTRRSQDQGEGWTWKVDHFGKNFLERSIMWTLRYFLKSEMNFLLCSLAWWRNYTNCTRSHTKNINVVVSCNPSRFFNVPVHILGHA